MYSGSCTRGRVVCTVNSVPCLSHGNNIPTALKVTNTSALCAFVATTTAEFSGKDKTTAAGPLSVTSSAVRGRVRTDS